MLTDLRTSRGLVIEFSSALIQTILSSFKDENGIALGSNYDIAKPQNGIAPAPNLT